MYPGSMNSIWCRHLIETPSPYKNPRSTLFFRLGTLPPSSHYPTSTPTDSPCWLGHTLIYLSYFLASPSYFQLFCVQYVFDPYSSAIYRFRSHVRPYCPSITSLCHQVRIWPTPDDSSRALHSQSCIGMLGLISRWFLDMTKDQTRLGSNWRSNWPNWRSNRPRWQPTSRGWSLFLSCR